MSRRRRCYELLESRPAGDRVAQRVGAFLMVLIGLNVLAAVLGTVRAIGQRAPELFLGFEVLSVAIFTVEYVARIWCCVEDPRWASPVRGRLRFALTPMALLDLIAIAPFFLSGLSIDARFARVFRLFRAFRLAKLGRHSTALRLLGAAFRRQREQLVLSVAVLVFLLVLAASLMYHAESEAQPDVFTSIPASMWWAVTTLTTVGYGDTYPITAAGKLIASVIAILGIGLFALPTSILGAGLVEESAKGTTGPRACPHCGGTVPAEP